MIFNGFVSPTERQVAVHVVFTIPVTLEVDTGIEEHGGAHGSLNTGTIDNRKCPGQTTIEKGCTRIDWLAKAHRGIYTYQKRGGRNYT